MNQTKKKRILCGAPELTVNIRKNDALTCDARKEHSRTATAGTTATTSNRDTVYRVIALSTLAVAQSRPKRPLLLQLACLCSVPVANVDTDSKIASATEGQEGFLALTESPL
jgi:hypothetical protein